MTIASFHRHELGGGLSIRLPGLAAASLGTRAATAAGAPGERPAPAHRARRPEDTADGCRANAAADLARAAALTGDHIRWRFEHSAAAWTARADLLARLEASFDARRARRRG